MRLNCKENQTTKQHTKWELTCKGQTKLVAEDSNAREFVFQQRLYSEPPPSHCHQKEDHSMHVDGWVQPLGGNCAMSLISLLVTLASRRAWGKKACQAVNLINATQINDPSIYSPFSTTLGDIQKE